MKWTTPILNWKRYSFCTSLCNRANTSSYNGTPSTPCNQSFGKEKTKSQINNRNTYRNNDKPKEKEKPWKICSGPSNLKDPLEGPSNAFPQSQPLPRQAPPKPPLPSPIHPPQHAPHNKQNCPNLTMNCCIILPKHQKPAPIKSCTCQDHIPLSETHPKTSHKLSLPSLSPSFFSSSELFPATEPEPVTPTTSDHPSSPQKLSWWQTKAANWTNQNVSSKQCRKAMALCTDGLESVVNFQLWKTLKPLLDLERVNRKGVCNPVNFSSAPMVTTFVRSSGDRTKGIWKFLDTVCQTDTGIRLVELEHDSLKTISNFCVGRVPIYVRPSFYRALKGVVPMWCWRVIGNKRWASLKFRIRNNVIKYSQQLTLNRAKKAKSLEDRLSRAMERRAP